MKPHSEKKKSGRTSARTSNALPKDGFLELVPSDGSTISSRRLRERLGWTQGEYHSVRDQLLRDGLIRIGRGRGGTVSRTQTAEPAESRRHDGISPKKRPRENGIYPGFHKGLKKWSADQGWTDCLVEQLAHQGKRQTGGKWTRPDFVVVGIRKYDYTPGVVRDIETFEVKLSSCGVDAVFEAAAHSRVATKSYLAVQRDTGGPEEEELGRIEAECQRFRIGLIVFDDPADPDNWDYRVDPPRGEPDPEYVEEFVNAQIRTRGNFEGSSSREQAQGAV